MNRGSHASRDGQGRGAGASMRPRFMNRGSIDTLLKRKIITYASMRPRFMNRGSNIMYDTILNEVQLQ